MAKIDGIVEMLESRIRRGDYALREVPPDRRLADEVGVSRMTARKAVLQLIDKGLLDRQANGRIVVRQGKCASDAALQIGFLFPGEVTPGVHRWHSATLSVAEKMNVRVRSVTYHHWDDPVLAESSANFDGLFLVPPGERVPAAVGERLRLGRARVVAVDADLSEHGIRSFQVIPPSGVQRLLDHLLKLGHRRIACFNTQPMDSIIEQRIGQWDLWRAAQGVEGILINEPETSYGRPMDRALTVMRERLSAGALNATALLCITMPAAMGAMRAFYERGIVVGKDVSVCAVNDEGLAHLFCPSLTSVRIADPLPYLTLAIEWMAGRQPAGPLLSRPDDIDLFVGESTGPAPGHGAAAVLRDSRRRVSLP